MVKQQIGYTALFIMSALTGCSDGAGGGNPVPPNSTVQLNQSGITWDIGETASPCRVRSNPYNDHTIAISVLDPNGSPLGNVDFRVVVDLSGNTYFFEPAPPEPPGLPVLQLYEDRNGNGVVDDPEELVSSNTSSAFKTTTDQYTGTKMVLLRVNLSCTYRGNLHVFAGAAYGSVNVEVKTITPP